jgi:hypothetical protein
LIVVSDLPLFNSEFGIMIPLFPLRLRESNLNVFSSGPFSGN